MSIRIAHFTDLHITASPHQIPYGSLLGKRAIGWANLKFRRRFSAVQAAKNVAIALVKDISDLAPDHLVVTGDITGLSLPIEFETAHDILTPLFLADRTTVLPGNHDVYVQSAVRKKLYEKWFGEWTSTDLQPDDDLLNGSKDYPFPLVRFLGDDAVLLCLRDARPNFFCDSSGKVPLGQIEALERILSSRLVDNRTIILALHYGLVDKNRNPDGFFHRLHNASIIQKLAERYEVSLVIHGHLHERFVHKQNDVGKMAIANPGAVAFRGLSMAYHLYEIHKDHIVLNSRRFDSESGEFSSWPEAPGNGVIWSSVNRR